MDTEMKRTLIATKEKMQYDEAAKKILRHKSILAHILVRVIDEFRGLDWRVVESLIEGEPIIGKVPVDSGLTNAAYKQEAQHCKMIAGLNTEDAEMNEGTIRFDSIFYVRMPEGLSQMIFNIEAQKDEPDTYCILNRATYYECRMVSSQKERDFHGMNYDDIKKVYSIWICMNMKECIFDYYCLDDKKILGNYQWKGKADILNIVLLGVPNKLPDKEEKYELHRLLAALFGIGISDEERIKIIDEEYHIPMEENFRKEINEMCNLSDGVWEHAMTEGFAQGMAQGMAQGIEQGVAQGMAQGRNNAIIKMHEFGISCEQISEMLQLGKEEIREIIQKGTN